MGKRVIKILGGSFAWSIFFWTFLIVTFPGKTAKDWLSREIEKGLNAKVRIDELKIGWNLGVRLKGIAIDRQSSPLHQGEGEGGFALSLTSLRVKPKLLSLIKLKPDLDFNGSTPSGGDFTGSYDSGELSISFKDISFKDLTISGLPLPSAATAYGSGKLKFIKGKGTIDIEVDGIPGGKQALKAAGGEGPGLDGKLKITVSLPKL